jgi:hypothetical protein
MKSLEFIVFEVFTEKRSTWSTKGKCGKSSSFFTWIIEMKFLPSSTKAFDWAYGHMDQA